MNKPNTNYYYIASPGWSDKDKEDLEFIEDTLDAQHMDYFSPFKHGGMLKLHDNLEKSKVSVKAMFDENVNQIFQATNMIARTEGFDKGTFFEIGLFMAHNPDWMSSLTLIGENSEEASKILFEVYKQYIEYINKMTHQEVVVDISNKTIDKYVMLGLWYGTGYTVITFSDKELDSNIMTACSAHFHFTATEDIPTANHLRYLIETDPDWRSLFDTKICNLSALKVSKSIK